MLPALAIAACSTPSDKPLNKFSDPVVVRIAEFKDRRLADSLYPYFNHENALYRQEAVNAFASIQEIHDIDRIGKLLMMDPDAGVRHAAAFALGQVQHNSSERLLLGALVREKVPEITMTILEAYGKVTNQWKLEPEPFLDDTLESSGLAWSLYRAGLRGKVDSTSNGVAKLLIHGNRSLSTRLGAAHFFARGARHFQDAEAVLITAATDDKSPDVRMAAAMALGKITTTSALDALRAIIASEKDARVVVNAVRSLRSFSFDQVERILYECLRHRDTHVRITTSEVIRDAATNNRWTDVSSQANHVNEWRVKANLLEGALRAGQHKSLVAEIQSYYHDEKDLYAKSAFLKALTHYPSAAEFVAAELAKADTAAIRSTAAATLVGMNYSPYFPATQRKRFAAIYRDIITTSDDPAVIGTIAGALADSALRYRGVVQDVAFLKEARGRLKLPQHIEALQPVAAAIALLEGKESPDVRNEYNHPIDWEFVRSLPEDMVVTIKTSRGDVRVRLFVNEAPGSVANFVRLAQGNYFDDKLVHRVVPNFVVQAGCNRGDGWGSEDYSIRSEFSSKRYGTGALGMASAGKDTEGTQWFITHSPTPHLDGRYTIFGEVVDGMKAVDFIEVGDRINDVDVADLQAQ